jgi:hypothetical protein
MTSQMPTTYRKQMLTYLVPENEDLIINGTMSVVWY